MTALFTRRGDQGLRFLTPTRREDQALRQADSDAPGPDSAPPFITASIHFSRQARPPRIEESTRTAPRIPSVSMAEPDTCKDVVFVHSFNSLRFCCSHNGTADRFRSYSKESATVRNLQIICPSGLRAGNPTCRHEWDIIWSYGYFRLLE